jgi:hypothetical protein
MWNNDLLFSVDHYRASLFSSVFLVLLHTRRCWLSDVGLLTEGEGVGRSPVI